MDPEKLASLKAGYDKVAAHYVERIFNELDHKPLDRLLLDRFAESIGGSGRTCDVGCGPGHVTNYLRQRGVNVFGIDLSSAMVDQARQLCPGIEFKTGNMLSLELESESLAAIVAFYSIIHVHRDEVVNALAEMKRVLEPGGRLLLAFHIGDEILHLDEWWEEPVSVDFVFFKPDEMRNYLERAGLEIEEVIEREPYPDVEHPSRRAYIFSRKALGVNAETV
ncbi:MAG TPA: methyltransferase domain-containing protein [Blastocatellia bacterium]|nr:methyltransferase domain-containing protein [Blastocatellia bacterium]